MKKSLVDRIPIIAMILFIPTLIYQLLSDDPTHEKGWNFFSRDG